MVVDFNLTVVISPQIHISVNIVPIHVTIIVTGQNDKR